MPLERPKVSEDGRSIQLPEITNASGKTVRPLPALLAEFRHGSFAVEASVAFHELIGEVLRTEKAGEFVLKAKVKREGGELEVAWDFVPKTPRLAAPSQRFYVDRVIDRPGLLRRAFSQVVAAVAEGLGLIPLWGSAPDPIAAISEVG